MMIPDSKVIDVKALNSAFKSTTNSYKYLFFISMLELMSEELDHNGFDTKQILKRMISIAWYPAEKFKLSFGIQDQTRTVTSLFDSEKTVRSLNHEELPEKAHKLLNYVPFRFLRPFFKNELAGLKDVEINAKILKLSQTSAEGRCPYKILAERNRLYIQLDPIWKEYFLNNLPILLGWSKFNWIKYLQSRNPNSPAISSKIESYRQRASLKKQRILWYEFLTAHTTRCIFTKEVITPDHFELDHYIPWSFIAHDQIWNLVPVSKEVNLRKSDSVPSKSFIRDLANLQASAVKFWVANGKSKVILGDYSEGIGIDVSIFTIDDFISKYIENLETLTNSAKLQGFKGDWGR